MNMKLSFNLSKSDIWEGLAVRYDHDTLSAFDVVSCIVSVYSVLILLNENVSSSDVTRKFAHPKSDHAKLLSKIL